MQTPVSSRILCLFAAIVVLYFACSRQPPATPVTSKSAPAPEPPPPRDAELLRAVNDDRAIKTELRLANIALSESAAIAGTERQQFAALFHFVRALKIIAAQPGGLAPHTPSSAASESALRNPPSAMSWKDVAADTAQQQLVGEYHDSAVAFAHAIFAEIANWYGPSGRNRLDRDLKEVSAPPDITQAIHEAWQKSFATGPDLASPKR